MEFKVIVKKILNKLYIRVFYPFYFFIYETFHKNYCILTASVTPYKHNWGDDMSVVLAHLINPDLKYIIHRYTFNFYRKEDYLCIGSIISWMTHSNSIIWGSGVVHEEQQISARPKFVTAVRGPLTREYLIKQGITCPEIYGDPALLFPRFYKPKVKKTYKLGVIPHYRDKKNLNLDRFKCDPDVLIIDVENITPWHRFIDEICSCERIVSSSLHGIIVSDAYMIPNSWCEFENGEMKRFAFKDYLLSVNRECISPSMIINDKTIIDDLISSTFNWHPISIDLDLLLSVCPFKNN